MIKEEAFIDGEKIEVVTQLDDEVFEREKNLGQEMDETIDLTEVIEQTQIINRSDIDEQSRTN